MLPYDCLQYYLSISYCLSSFLLCISMLSCIYFSVTIIPLLVVKTKTMAIKKYTNINDVIEHLTDSDEDEDYIDVMINEETNSKQYDTTGSEDEENMPLAAHAASKPDVTASSEDEDEMPVALLQSTNDPTSSTSSKKTSEKRIFIWRKRDLPQAPHVFYGSQLSLSDEPKIPLQYFSMFLQKS